MRSPVPCRRLPCRFPRPLIRWGKTRTARSLQIRVLALAFLSTVLWARAPVLSQGPNFSTEIIKWPKEPSTLVFPAFLHTYGVRKATETHLRLYTKNRVGVEDPQGIAATRLKSWDDPKSKKDDDEITVYGVNSGYHMIIYNTSMTTLGFYGPKEKGERQLRFPHGITANSRGDVYVADTGNDRVVRFFNPKKNLRFVTALGSGGSEPGHFNQPRDVALDSRGNVYVADTGNHRIQVFDAQNELVRVFADSGRAEGQLWHPSAIAVADRWEPWSYYKDEFFVIIDLDRTRVQKFWMDGSFAAAVEVSELGLENASLSYVALDYYNNVWVTDQANHTIHKFDRNLNYLARFGSYGTEDREFVEPRGIAIYRRFGQVLIAERNTVQYYWIGTDVRDVRAEVDSARGLISLSYFLTEPAYIALRVKTPDGRETQPLKKVWRPSGANLEWIAGDGQSISGRVTSRNDNTHLAGVAPVSAGNYTLSLKIQPTYSSFGYFEKDFELRVRVF